MAVNRHVRPDRKDAPVKAYGLLMKRGCAVEIHRKLGLRGEIALLAALVINSFGVVLMLYSGSGISAISSVPYALADVWPALSLGTWTYLFQGLLVLSLMLLRRRFVVSYFLSFAVGFCFGELLDLQELWIGVLPRALPLRVLYFAVSYWVICLGVSLSNHCKMPIVPTDLFPRELSAITGAAYARIKMSFDLSCLAITALLTGAFLGHLDGLGIGTILAALTMGKAIGWMNHVLDRRVTFTSALEKYA